MDVFYITAAFSLGAYVWLIVILQLNTPNVVDVWEGVATLAAFPLLVYEPHAPHHPCPTLNALPFSASDHAIVLKGSSA